jgi:glycosyltransferase involved in cell wall biosynthesis
MNVPRIPDNRGSAPPTLSVVIASYNRASFLPDCIDSLRQAGVPDMEIVIVDDGSSDNTAEVVKTLGPGIVYTHQHNQGLSAARNTGIRHSTGRYIAYLDSDDFWLPGVAPKLIQFLDHYPDIGAVFAEAQVGNPNDGYRSWIQSAGQQAFFDLPHRQPEPGLRVLEPGPFFRGMLRRNAIFTGAILQRREVVFNAGLFDPENKEIGDWELWLRMIPRTTFAYWPEPLAIYTRHADNMTNNLDGMRRAFWETLDRYQRKSISLEPAERLLLQQCVQENLFSYAYHAWDRGDYPAARTRFARLVRDHGFSFRAAGYWLLAALPFGTAGGLRRIKHLLAG